MGRRAAALAATLATVAALVAPASPAEEPAPAGGWRVVLRTFPAEGVEHVRLHHDAGPVVVNLVVVDPGAPVRLRAMLSNERVAGPASFEPTSAMCRRVRCVTAVNGDFANPTTGEPVGGLVVDGRMLRSPAGAHHPQLSIRPDGRVVVEPLVWEASLRALTGEVLTVGGINVARRAGSLHVYTPEWAGHTGTDASGAEARLRLVGPGPAGASGTTYRVESVVDGGSTPIPGDGLVLSGVGPAAEAVRSLHRQVLLGDEVTLRLEVRAEGDPVQSSGGHPALVRDGEPVDITDTSLFSRARHPRTLLGVDGGDRLLLVTVDGRRTGHSLGATLAEARDLMVALGARQALNLDGGGSSTFVIRGGVVSWPSDRGGERGVSSSWQLVER